MPDASRTVRRVPATYTHALPRQGRGGGAHPEGAGEHPCMPCPCLHALPLAATVRVPPVPFHPAQVARGMPTA